MSRLIFNADTLGGTTTLSSADAVGNFTLTVPAVNGTLSVKDASNDATFRNITLTGAVLAGAWNGSTIAVAYGGTGATTLTGYVKGNGTSAMTASATIPNTDITGLGTMSVQGSDAVTITGGTANGLTIGASNPAAATFTTLRFNSTLSVAGTTGTSGQVLTSNGASAPTWQNIAGSGTVTSIDVSGGTTGLTTSGGPVTGAGTITLAGTLAVANGGTGAVTLTGYVKGNGTSAMTASATIPTTDLSGTITNDQLANSAITINGTSTSLGGSISVGTVTSVAGTGTVNGLTLTGTVTSSGSLTLGGTLSLVSPPAIGSTTPNTGDFTTLTSSTSFVPTAYTETIVASGTVGASATLAITAGTILTATLTSATACTFTMPTATAGKSFTLLLKQPASGTPTTATFTDVKWGSIGAPTITATVGKLDILAFIADGTNWYGTASQGYTY